MKNRTKHVFDALGIGTFCLLVGFAAGRFTQSNAAYSDVTNVDEQMLVGKWEMQIVGEDVPIDVEFRSDRTTTRYNSDGTQNIVANWGISNGELQIQNARDSGEYMAPTIFSLDKLESRIVHLTSRSKDAHFVLKKRL